MKRFTSSLKKKIAQYRKNRIDISPLIEGYSLKGEDVSGCIIKNLNRIEEDLSYCNFSFCEIGEKGKITFLSKANISDCNFKDTKFLGEVYMRRTIGQRANFENAYVPFVQYQNSDFTDAIFCNTTWQLGSRCGFKSKFSRRIFDMIGLVIE